MRVYTGSTTRNSEYSILAGTGYSRQSRKRISGEGAENFPFTVNFSIHILQMDAVDDDADATSALERQLDEITAVGHIFCSDGEFISSQSAAGNLCVTLALREGETRATLHVTLPVEYPAVPAELELSCADFDADVQQTMRSTLVDLVFLILK